MLNILFIDVGERQIDSHIFIIPLMCLLRDSCMSPDWRLHLATLVNGEGV